MKKKKSNHLTFTTKEVHEGVKRDLIEATSKQEEVTVGELSTEMLKNKYLTELFACVKRAKKIVSDDFFIEVITTLEKPVRKIIRRRFIWRYSCPTPIPGSAVYKYIAKIDELDFLWDLPSNDACEWIIHNKHSLNPKHHANVLKTVLEYYDQSLHGRARELNGEKDDNVVIHRIVDDEQYERIARHTHKRKSH